MTLSHEYRNPDQTPTLYVAPSTDNGTALQLTGFALSTANALAMAIVDGTGAQITSFGGGTQYANGTANATPTGTLALGYDGANLRALLTDTNGLLKENLTQVGGSAFALGQQLSTASLPIVLTAAQLTTLTPIPTPASVVSTNNSSTATLLAGAVFTGTADDCITYSEIRVTVIASHASAADGISIQQSSDSTNWDITDVYTIAATTGKTFVVPRQARYMRVVYTNGGTNQTSFRLQTILNRTGTTPSSQRASDGYTNETDLQEVWAFGALYNGTTWDRSRGDATNGAFVNLKAISGTTLTMGQQTAANSIPVILPSATITTLTPPTNAGYALDASLTTLNTSVNTLLKPASTLAAVTTLTNQSQEGGVNISLNAGAVDTGTRRVVQANGAGKTIVSVGGNAALSGNNTLIAAGTNKLKIFAFSLSTTSATPVLCIFQSGAGGTELWRVRLQAPTSVSTGANLAVSPPAWLFATAAATLLNLNLSGAQSIDWSASYFDEA